MLAFALALLVGLTGCGSKYSRSTPEALGISVFEAIKNMDREGMRDLMPTKDDLLATVRDSELSEEEKAEALKAFEENWDKMELEITREIDDSFDELMQEEGEDAPDWPTAEIDIVAVGKPRIREKLRMTDIKVHFKCGDRRFRIDVRKSAQLNSGWVMSPDGFRIRRER
ncbi:MAG TPA: hypothetical protein ENJ82_00255 [Bacteroidetes bacterium]|nr:hypothetical protein [Bacteroidota bacterium]